MSLDIKVPSLDGSDAQPENNSTKEGSRKMCKSRAEGGLRCSAHTKKAMVNAAAAVEAAKTKAAGSSTPGQRDKANAALAKAQAHFEEKQAEFLTSPAGIELLESKAQEARLAGDEEKAARFQEQAEASKAARRNQKAFAEDARRLDEAAQLLIDLTDRVRHPEGKFDSASRWYPSEAEWGECCDSIRSPSRAHPYSYMVHCRSAVHIAEKTGYKAALLRARAKEMQDADR